MLKNQRKVICVFCVHFVVDRCWRHMSGPTWYNRNKGKIKTCVRHILGNLSDPRFQKFIDYQRIKIFDIEKIFFPVLISLYICSTLNIQIIFLWWYIRTNWKKHFSERCGTLFVISLRLSKRQFFGHRVTILSWLSFGCPIYCRSIILCSFLQTLQIISKKIIYHLSGQSVVFYYRVIDGSRAMTW